MAWRVKTCKRLVTPSQSPQVTLLSLEEPVEAYAGVLSS